MGRCRSAVVAVCLAGAMVRAQTPAPDPAAILATARAALGGARLSEITTFVATGRTRQVRGDNLVPIEFEISCVLPDRYIRRDEIPAQENGPTMTGFTASGLIESPSPAAPPMRSGAPPPPGPDLDAARNARLADLREDVARLMLGLFAGAFSSVPVTFRLLGLAEAPQGQADVIEVAGPGNFSARLFVDRTTHLPLMVSWQAAPRGAARGVLRPGPAGTTIPGVPPGPLPAPGISPPPGAPGPGSAALGGENRLYFADYRDVDGVKWPFRIRRAIGADTIEETTIDRYRLNVRIDPKKFEVR
jgi:hypothetical protein